MSGFNEHEEYAQYAKYSKYLATPAIPVPTERIIQCMKLILNQNISSEKCRFEDKLPEIKYMSKEETMNYLIEVNNNK